MLPIVRLQYFDKAIHFIKTPTIKFRQKQLWVKSCEKLSFHWLKQILLQEILGLWFFGYKILKYSHLLTW